MEITYLGHSSFKFKGKTATVVCDPYDKYVGFVMPKVSADIVTVSHDHKDHNTLLRVSGTSRRPEPFVIRAPGEYEVSQVGVFGWGSYHDQEEGSARGKNTIYTIHMDMLNIVHLGDLGHMLSDEMIENLGAVDILCVPVGGTYTLDAATAARVTKRLKPAIVLPMHYKLEQHDVEAFGSLVGIELFLKEMDAEKKDSLPLLKVTEQDLPEETEVVVLEPQLSA
jgi:L-ascorbate metabolism protein UlaG (beta-lactamase superfamily)